MTRENRLPWRAMAPGIPQALARWRARHCRDLHYTIDAAFTDAVDAIEGTIDVRCTLTRRVPLVLDWRATDQANARVVSVNDRPAAGNELRDGHFAIAAEALTTGENLVRLAFRAPVAASGCPLTRYADSADGAIYVHSLLVPADASAVFPCIDQPDLKARFTLSLDVPAQWTAISNAPLVSSTTGRHAGRSKLRFATTEPFSTYLFAFAAGPFVMIDTNDPVKMVVRRSREHEARAAAGEVLRLNRAAIDYCADFSGHAFPFAKYDLVLIPEFAYNGMEHAGATFLREEAVLLPADADGATVLRRAHLLFHETAHQWFGDLVTMRWFDDLWLKEGFANLLAALISEAVCGADAAWSAFLALKSTAYRTDATTGTVPLHQPLANLADAKSLYGTIVYGKAPAVLRQLLHDLGHDVFREGIRRLVARHAWSAFDSRDLLEVLEEASGRSLKAWARAWIVRPGMPRITVSRRGAALELRQRAATGQVMSWPQRVRIATAPDNTGTSASATVDCVLQRSHHIVPVPAAAITLPNDGDFGYGLFICDAPTLFALPETLSEDMPALRRALVWNAAWDGMRDGALTPAAYIESTCRWLVRERDGLLLATLLARLDTAVRRFCHADVRDLLAARIEQTLRTAAEATSDRSLQSALRRAVSTMASSPQSASWLNATARDARVPGDLRHLALRNLLARGDQVAWEIATDQAGTARTNDEERTAFATGAAWPGRKAEVFARMTGDATLPEAWIEAALVPFNLPEQESLTRRFLVPALDVLPALKRHRKIFFVNRWLEAFIGGQSSVDACALIDDWLSSRPALDPDLRRKVLECRDELALAARLRAVGEGRGDR